MPSFLLELIGCVASMVAIYLICGQSRCLSARGILSVRHLLLGFFATKNPPATSNGIIHTIFQYRKRNNSPQIMKIELLISAESAQRAL